LKQYISIIAFSRQAAVGGVNNTYSGIGCPLWIIITIALTHSLINFLKGERMFLTKAITYWNTHTEW